MDIEIRKINPDTDLDAMHVLTEQLGYPTTLENFKLRIQQLYQHSDYHTFVATYLQKVVAYIGCIKQYAWETDGCFFRIQALVVNQDFRQKGIGKKLIGYVENQAMIHQAHYLILNSGNRPEREIAHKFYINLGFEAKSTGFRKTLAQDA
nr:GNAT family N-acetyltransferase [Acinetobacter sp. Marseille-Q1620]